MMTITQATVYNVRVAPHFPSDPAVPLNSTEFQHLSFLFLFWVFWPDSD